MATATMAPAADLKRASTIAEPVRKKLKTSDLPISSATRGVIDALAHSMKKDGKYDRVRQAAWQALTESVCFILAEL